jgi:hypothetical protein
VKIGRNCFYFPAITSFNRSQNKGRHRKRCVDSTTNSYRKLESTDQICHSSLPKPSSRCSASLQFRPFQSVENLDASRCRRLPSLILYTFSIGVYGVVHPLPQFSNKSSRCPALHRLLPLWSNFTNLIDMSSLQKLKDVHAIIHVMPAIPILKRRSFRLFSKENMIILRSRMNSL